MKTADFNPGDKVRLVGTFAAITKGKVYTVLDPEAHGWDPENLVENNYVLVQVEQYGFTHERTYKANMLEKVTA